MKNYFISMQDEKTFVYRNFQTSFLIFSKPCRDQGSKIIVPQALRITSSMQPTLPHRTRTARQDPGSRFDSEAKGRIPSHPQAWYRRDTVETSSSSNGISKRKEDPGVPCSFGSKEKSKPNFKQRKQKATLDSERHHITFLAFRGCLRGLDN